MKFKLSRAINCATRVVVHGYEIDAFEEADGVHLLTCSGVIEFRIPDQEVEFESPGLVKLHEVLHREPCTIQEWGKYEEIHVEFLVEHAMGPEDLK